MQDIEINALNHLAADVRKTLINHALARDVLQEWVSRKGHERCWYYPEIFEKLCEYLEIETNLDPKLPPRPEFRSFCQKFENEQAWPDNEPEYVI